MATGSTTTGSLREPDSGPRRRRPSSTTERILETAKHAEQKVEKALLVLWDDLPAWRRDNHFIRSGYREESNSYWRSFTSLFYVHNEFVNIWTHAVGAVVFPLVGAWLYHVIAPRYASATSADVLVFSCFFGGALLCLGMSATFHALMNHSEDVAKWGNKLDYSGIVFLIVGSYVPALYYSLFCLPALLTVYMYAVSVVPPPPPPRLPRLPRITSRETRTNHLQIFALGFGCGVVSWVDRFRTPAWRVYRTAMFVGLGVSGVVPICHASVIYGYETLQRRLGLNWVLLQGFFYIFGACLYAVSSLACRMHPHKYVREWIGEAH